MDRILPPFFVFFFEGSFPFRILSARNQTITNRLENRFHQGFRTGCHRPPEELSSFFALNLTPLELGHLFVLESPHVHCMETLIETSEPRLSFAFPREERRKGNRNPCRMPFSEQAYIFGITSPVPFNSPEHLSVV